MILEGLQQAFGILTCVSYRETSRSSEVKTIAYSFVAFPVIGLFFGILAMFIVRFAFPILPIFTAWFVPALWLCLSGGKQLRDLCCVVHASSSSAQRGERLQTLAKAEVNISAMATAVVLFLGKVFALQQAQVLDFRSIILLVVFVPMFSRYVALMLALSDNDSVDRGVQVVRPLKLRVVLAASLMVLLASLYAIGLGLLLIVASMLLAVCFRWFADNRFGGVVTPVWGALIEVSEVFMMWVVVIFAASGLNVALLG